MATSAPKSPVKTGCARLRTEDCTRADALLGVQLTEQGLIVPRFAMLSWFVGDGVHTRRDMTCSYASTVAAAQTQRNYPKEFIGDRKMCVKTMTT